MRFHTKVVEYIERDLRLKVLVGVGPQVKVEWLACPSIEESKRVRHGIRLSLPTPFEEANANLRALSCNDRIILATDRMCPH